MTPEFGLIRMSKPKLLVTLTILLAIVFPIFVLEAAASSMDEANSAIRHAEETAVSAYEAVLEAERAGGNVSGLLVRLDDAGELLAKARVEYGLEKFEETILSANNCSRIAESIEMEAEKLQAEANESRVIISWLTGTGSLVGVAVVLFGSYWGWRVFKRRYIRRVLKMKPEVVKDET